MRAFAAILIRTLREHFRSRMLSAVRGIFAALVLFIIFIVSHGGSDAPGLEFLSGVLLLNFLFILLAATSYFSSAITEEKEEGTIGLLQMAGVSPTGLLLAKSGTRILEGILLLAVQFPFAMMAVTLGGATLEQVAAGYLALGAFLFLAGNLALVASVLASRTITAVPLTAALLGLVFVANIMPEPLAGTAFNHQWRALNITNRLSEITSIGFDGVLLTAHFRNSIILGLAAFAVARLCFERFGNASSESGGGLMNYFASTREDRRYAPRPLPGATHAIGWKDFHFLFGGNRLQRWKLRAYAFGAVLIIICHLPGFDGRTVTEMAYWIIASGLLIRVLEIAYSASQLFATEIRSKMLGSLAALPDFDIPRVMRSKIMMVKQTLKAADTTTSIGIVVMAFGPLFASSDVRAGLGIVVMGSVFGMGLLILFGLVYLPLLERIIIHLSLRIPWGSMGLGIGVWLVFSAINLILLGVIVPFVGVFLSLISAHVLSWYIDKWNIERLESLATDES
jgi:hypothetical protein